jgi:hypothetical protein
LTCAEALLTENIVGIANKQGFAFKRQARGMMRYAESVLLDDAHVAP